MLSYDFGGIGMGDTPAQTSHLEQRTYYEPGDYREHRSQSAPEKEAAAKARQPAEVLQQHRSQEQHADNGDGIQRAPHQEAFVILPDKGVESLQYVGMLRHDFR